MGRFVVEKHLYRAREDKGGGGHRGGMIRLGEEHAAISPTAEMAHAPLTSTPVVSLPRTAISPSPFVVVARILAVVSDNSRRMLNFEEVSKSETLQLLCKKKGVNQVRGLSSRSLPFLDPLLYKPLRGEKLGLSTYGGHCDVEARVHLWMARPKLMVHW